jgi:hypothetical protein
MRVIYIDSSKVAAAIGYNQWLKPEDLARTILEEQFGCYEVTEDDPDLNTVPTPHQIMQDWLVDHQHTVVADLAKEKMTCVEAAPSVRRKTSLEAKLLQQEAESVIVEALVKPTDTSASLPKLSELIAEERALEAELASTDDPTLAKQVRKVARLQEVAEEIAAIPAMLHQSVSMATGVLAEEAILNNLQKDIGQPVTDRNTKMIYKYHNMDDGWSWKVGGRLDGRVGIEVDSTTGLVTVVEVKNRQNRHFRQVPRYERVQCQVYMWLTNASKCVFREHFHGETWTTDIEYDEAELATIQAKLVTFADTFILPNLGELPEPQGGKRKFNT